MNEKHKHYRSILVDVIGWLLAGAFAIGLIHLQDGALWLDICIALFFITIAITVVVSPRFRRYMRMQYPGGNQRPDPDIIGKYTILEAELDDIRNACVEELRKERPSIELVRWDEPAWDAISDDRPRGVHFAIFPAVIRNTSVAVPDYDGKGNHMTSGFHTALCPSGWVITGAPLQCSFQVVLRRRKIA